VAITHCTSKEQRRNAISAKTFFQLRYRVLLYIAHIHDANFSTDFAYFVVGQFWAVAVHLA